MTRTATRARRRRRAETVTVAPEVEPAAAMETLRAAAEPPVAEPPVATGPTIERGVPMPSRNQRVGQVGYPFAEMEVGDSFVVPKARGEHARGAAWAYKEANPGFDYMTKTVVPEGIRVWRVA